MINRKINTGEMLPAELISRIGAATADATISDSELEKVIKNVADNNPKAVLDYKNGKEQVIMFLVGQVMKQTAGKAKADEIKEQLKKLIQK
jgi:aspartyl-tRNA(Asn)/glutamyl-tRNA(Gln) amidotransferase subunit B